MDLCNSEQPPWISMHPVPIAFPMTTTQISSRRGPIQVTSFPLYGRSRLASLHLLVDLFVSGEDFSWQAIQKGRNQYYQKQLANQIEAKTTSTLSLLTTALNVHLNMGQNLTMNTSSLFMTLETISIESLAQRTVQQPGNAHIQIPSSIQFNSTKHTSVSLRVRLSSSVTLT